MKTRMNIGLNITKHFMKYAYVLVKSIFENNRDSEVHIYIVSSVIRDEDMRPFNALADKYDGCMHLVSIEFERIKEKFISSLPDHLLAIHTPYFQIMELPDDVDRILFFDGDMIVIKSLKELYEMDFEDNYVICLGGECVNDELIDWHSNFERMNCTRFSTPCTLYDVKKIKMDFTQEDIWNADKEVCRIWGWSNEEYGYALLFNGKEKYVPETKYGFYITGDVEQKFTKEEIARFIDEAVVIHYFQTHPWGPNSGLTKLQKYWWDYAVDSPWYEEYVKDFWDFWERFRYREISRREDGRELTVLSEYFMKEFEHSFQSFKNQRVALYGTGYKTKIILNRMKEYNFVALLDKELYKQGQKIGGLEVMSSEQVDGKIDLIIIAANRQYWNEIRERIKKDNILHKYPVYYLSGEKVDI